MKLGFDINKKQKDKAQTSRTKQRRLFVSSPMLSFLFFLFLAFIFWFVQNLQREVTRMVYVPLSSESVGLDDVDTQELPNLIAVSLQDKTIQHILYRLGRFTPISLRVYKDASGKTSHIGVDVKDLEEELLKRFSTSAKIIQIRPEYVRIDLSNRTSKIVPIRLSEAPKVTEGYTVEQIRLYPDSVQIFGPKEIVDTLKAIYTKPFEQDKINQSKDVSLSLSIPRRISSRVGAIGAFIGIEPLIERSYQLQIHPKGEPEGYRLFPLPNAAKLTITIPLSKQEDPALSDLRLVVDLNYLRGKATTSEDTKDPLLPVTLENAPEWIKRIQLEPQSVQYVLERE